MSRRIYTDEDRARVFAGLTANEGNVKRTSRELAIPEQTVRDWKKEWEREGVPDEVSDALPAIAGEFVSDMERVRDAALLMIEKKLPEAKVGELNAVVGTLTDKIRLVQGQATSRKETVVSGPTPQELGQALQEYLEQTVAAQLEREADIVDAEVVEQAPAALPPVVLQLDEGE